jgi:Zinc finger, C3HC4 type (RING finger)
MESHHIGHELVAKPAKLFYCDCGARSLCESLEAPIAPVSIVPPAGGSSTPLDPSVDDTTLCCICVDAAKDTLLSHGDHGHLCVCFPCGKSLEARGSACPVCRQVILAVTKVYA